MGQQWSQPALLVSQSASQHARQHSGLCAGTKLHREGDVLPARRSTGCQSRPVALEPHQPKGTRRARRQQSAPHVSSPSRLAVTSSHSTQPWAPSKMRMQGRPFTPSPRPSGLFSSAGRRSRDYCDRPRARGQAARRARRHAAASCTSLRWTPDAKLCLRVRRNAGAVGSRAMLGRMPGEAWCRQSTQGCDRAQRAQHVLPKHALN